MTIPARRLFVLGEGARGAPHLQSPVCHAQALRRALKIAVLRPDCNSDCDGRGCRRYCPQAGAHRDRVGDASFETVVGPGNRNADVGGTVVFRYVAYGNGTGTCVPMRYAFHQLTQFANIADVFPVQEEVTHLIVQGNKILQKMTRERHDVVAPFPDRRGAKYPTGNAVIEVEPKVPALDEVAKIAVRRANQSEVGLKPYVPAHAFIGLFLNRTQKLRLKRRHPWRCEHP
jgi:hypothetical protein